MGMMLSYRMDFNLVFFALILLISFGSMAGCNGEDGENLLGADGHPITFVNKCKESIWIGGFSGSGVANAVPLPEPNWGPNGTPSWEIPAGKTRSLTVPFCWTAGQFFARTGCTGSGETLNCTSGDCGGELNCGTNGKGGENPALAEFTMDGGAGSNCIGGDNYDVSMVAGFNVAIEIEPDILARDRICGNAGVCDKLPECPWDTFLWDNGMWAKNTSSAIGTCLAPQNMAASDLEPFTGMPAGSADFNKLGCACPDKSGCGTGEMKGFCCSPFNTDGGVKGCIQDFSQTGGCFPNDCASTGTYNMDQICDPFGQCDSDLMRDAIWPEGSNGVAATDYRDKIRAVCGTEESGIYTWAFDDLANVPGLSGGGFQCFRKGKTVSNGIGYKIFFTCE